MRGDTHARTHGGEGKQPRYKRPTRAWEREIEEGGGSARAHLSGTVLRKSLCETSCARQVDSANTQRHSLTQILILLVIGFGTARGCEMSMAPRPSPTFSVEENPK